MVAINVERARQAVDRLLTNAIDMDKAINNMAIAKQQVHDFTAPLTAWEPVVTGEGKFALRNLKDGRDYLPTETALNHMGGIGKMSTWALNAMTTPVVNTQKKDKKTGEPEIVYQRDARDAEVLRDYVKVHLFQRDRIDMDKPRLFRTWDDGTLRAVLSKDYVKVDNQWLIQTAKAFLPQDAKVIRYRGNADTMYMDILLPNSITDTDDGGLGGMIHLGNSEIGERRVIVTPSILRMICTNGAIGWAKLEEEIKMVHRRKDGKIDMAELESKIRSHIEDAMPTFAEGIAAMQGLRGFAMDDTPLANIFAQLAIDNSISKRDVKGVWGAWMEEANEVGAENARTAFGLQNAMTRYGQRLSPKEQYDFDTRGGKMMRHLFDKEWQQFLTRAKNLNAKKVEDLMGVAA